MSTRVTPGEGALLRPSFDSSYGVFQIEVLDGGAGYAQTDPPKVIIEGTTTPVTEGVLKPSKASQAEAKRRHITLTSKL